MDSKGLTSFIKVSPAMGSHRFAMGPQDMPPGTGISVHKHDDTAEILYVNEGRGTLILGEERRNLETNTTVLIPPENVAWRREAGQSHVCSLSRRAGGSGRILPGYWMVDRCGTQSDIAGGAW